MFVYKTHRVRPEDRNRIRCQWNPMGPGCDKPADVCHHQEWSVNSGRSGLSFYYYCDEHAAVVETTGKAYSS